MSIEEKKLTFKIKKPAAETLQTASPTPSQEGVPLDVFTKLGQIVDRIQSLKGVELEFAEIIIEGPLSLGGPVIAPLLQAMAPPQVAPPPPPKPQLLPFTFEVPKKAYPIKFSEVKIGAIKEEGGTRRSSIMVGGNEVPPLHVFEGKLPHRPLIAHAIFDAPKVPKPLKRFYGDVMADPAKWAQKCVNEFGAKMIALNIVSNRPLEEIVKTVKDVYGAVDVPVSVSVGSGDVKKDVELIEKCAEALKGERALLMITNLPMTSGFDQLPDEIPQYFRIIAKSGHVAGSYAPLLADRVSWLNKVALNEGVPRDRLVADPSIPAVGYSNELGLSAIDAIYQRAFGGEDTFTAPIIVAPMSAWMAREANMEKEELGPREQRGHTWEITTASAALASGAHILVMLDPMAIKVCEGIIDRLYTPIREVEPSEAVNWISELKS